MRWFLILWLGPLAIIGLWYGLSVNDINFGSLFLTREFHDRVFELYGSILGMEPEAIPPLLLKAVFVDTLIILAVIGFRRRHKIMASYRRLMTPAPNESEVLPIDPMSPVR